MPSGEEIHRKRVLGRKNNINEQFRFSQSDILHNSATARLWHQFVRKFEAKILLQLLGDRLIDRALEIGCGDGLQSNLIAARCGYLICSDIDNRRWEQNRARQIPKNAIYMPIDATDLSCFSDSSFDLLYSSNVLEHIKDIDRCLFEMHRVLKPSGLSIHSMPSRHWKLFNSIYRVARGRKPKIHGVECTNWKEFQEFGLSNWVDRMEKAGFTITETYGMPFYFGAGGRWRWIVWVGNRLYFPSSYTLFTQPTKRS